MGAAGDARHRAEASLDPRACSPRCRGPLDPNGTALTPAAVRRSCTPCWADPRGLPLAEPGTGPVPRPVYDAYRASAQYVSADGTDGQVRGPAAGRGPAEHRGDERHPGGPRRGDRGGAALRRHRQRRRPGRRPRLYDVSTRAPTTTWRRIIPIAVLAIAMLLGLVLRSLIAPLYLVVSIVLSYLAALGGATLLVIDLGGQDGLIFMLPFLMFVFLLALGEDYNILIMTRIREEAAAAAAAGGGGAGASAGPGRRSRRPGLILAGTFGVLAMVGGGVHGRPAAGSSGSGWRSASCWTPSWSGRCSCRRPRCCSAAGTGGPRA